MLLTHRHTSPSYTSSAVYQQQYPSTHLLQPKSISSTSSTRHALSCRTLRSLAATAAAWQASRQVLTTTCCSCGNHIRPCALPAQQPQMGAAHSHHPSSTEPKPGCIFCSIAQRHAQGDPGSRVLYDDPLVYVIRDIRPAAAQHLLVIPKAHVANVNSLTGADVGLVRHMHEVGQQQLQQLLAAGGSPPHMTAAGAAENQQQGSLLAPTVDEAAVVIHTPSAAVTPGFKFGFHKPPFRSIDHLHMHCFVLPHRWYRWWQYQCRFNWITSEDLIDELRRLPS